MKMLINDHSSFVSESIEGLIKLRFESLRCHHDPLFVCRREITQGKVALISGGGAGHEPAHVGFVGYGMLDAACPGQVFTSPVPDQIQAAIKYCDSGAGSLLIVKNYQGDVMNFLIAANTSDKTTAMVTVRDDISAGDNESTRGLTGVVPLDKMLGAAAEAFWPLDQLVVLAEKIVSRSATMGLMLSAPGLPQSHSRNFDIQTDKVEYGVGIHGEHGRSLESLDQVDALVAKIMVPILEKLSKHQGNELLLLVNGLGATPIAELWLVYRAASNHCEALGYTAVRRLVGNYVTSLNAAGCSVTAVLMDEEMINLWDFPVDTAALAWQ